MSKAFTTAAQYIEFLKLLPFAEGEVICTSFLPSALFQKDVISVFYQRREALQDARWATQMLWEYGKRLRRAVADGVVHLCIEERAVEQFCRKGIVHDGYPEYEVSFSTRAAVLKTLQKIANSGKVFVVRGPLPYIFRLHRPEGVLLDVTNNTIEQRVQGLWIEEESIVKAFGEEADRLLLSAQSDGSGNGLISKLVWAIEQFESGYPVVWNQKA